MSASSKPVLQPSAASAAARFTATVDLPTPPLPEATAILWRTPGMVGGFGVGLTGGAAHELRAQSVDALLPEGALLTLKLDQPLRACRSTPSRRPM